MSPRVSSRSVAAVVLAALAASCSAGSDGNPLADAVEGEWALYRMHGGIQTKQLVVDVTDAEIVIETSTLRNHELLAKSEDRVERAALRPEIEDAVVLREETLEIGGRPVRCRVLGTTEDGRSVESWVSHDVPVNGVVRAAVESRVLMQLVDFGSD